MREVPGILRSRPPEVWVLAVLMAMGSALCLIGALYPPTPASPTALNVVAGGIGAGMVALLWLPGAWLRTARLHVAVLVTMGLSLALVGAAATGEGAMASAGGIIWLGLYSAAFHPRHVARAYLLVASVGFWVALSANPVIRNLWASWLVIVVSTVIASEVYAGVLQRTRTLALTDPLTGLPNRLGLHERVAGDLRPARRGGRSLAVAIIDLDGFKQVNDTEGHQAGDRLLQALADQLSAGIRRVDGLFRTGGDEFLLLMPGLTMRQAEAAMVRLRDQSILRWSYGVVLLDPEEDLDSGLARADHLMYAHKQAAARDRVVDGCCASCRAPVERALPGTATALTASAGPR